MKEIVTLRVEPGKKGKDPVGSFNDCIVFLPREAEDHNEVRVILKEIPGKTDRCGRKMYRSSLAPVSEAEFYVSKEEPNGNILLFSRVNWRGIPVGEPALVLSPEERRTPTRFYPQIEILAVKEDHQVEIQMWWSKSHYICKLQPTRVGEAPVLSPSDFVSEGGRDNGGIVSLSPAFLNLCDEVEWNGRVGRNHGAIQVLLDKSELEQKFGTEKFQGWSTFFPNFYVGAEVVAPNVLEEVAAKAAAQNIAAQESYTSLAPQLIPEEGMSWKVVVYGYSMCGGMVHKKQASRQAPTLASAVEHFNHLWTEEFCSQTKLSLTLNRGEERLENIEADIHLPDCGNVDWPEVTENFFSMGFEWSTDYETCGNDGEKITIEISRW